MIPVVPSRGKADVALKIYIRPFSSIELACAVCQPSPCVHAFFESGVLLHMSHLKLHFALHASHSTLHTPHSTLHTARFTLHTPHFTLHTQLYTEKHKVSCSGFLPKRKPMQHSCSHYNAFYSMTWLTRMHLRTWQHQMATIMQPFQYDLQPQIQETRRTTHTGTTTRCRTQRGGTDWTRNGPNRTRRTHEVPFIAGWSHFTQKNTRFRAPASSPKESPCNIHAAITKQFAAWRG